MRLAQLLLATIIATPGWVRAEDGATIVRSAVPDPDELFRWRPPSAPEWASFAAFTGLVVADVGLTVHGLRDPRFVEQNAILGPRPSTARLLLVAGASVAVTGGVWYALPAPWRSIFLAVPIAAESMVVCAYAGSRFCANLVVTF